MTNRTALITCVERYMGLAIQKKIESQGINVVSGGYPMTTQEECEELRSWWLILQAKIVITWWAS